MRGRSLETGPLSFFGGRRGARDVFGETFCARASFVFGGRPNRRPPEKVFDRRPATLYCAPRTPRRSFDDALESSLSTNRQVNRPGGYSNTTAPLRARPRQPLRRRPKYFRADSHISPEQ